MLKIVPIKFSISPNEKSTPRPNRLNHRYIESNLYDKYYKNDLNNTIYQQGNILISKSNEFYGTTLKAFNTEIKARRHAFEHRNLLVFYYLM